MGYQPMIVRPSRSGLHSVEAAARRWDLHGLVAHATKTASRASPTGDTLRRVRRATKILRRAAIAGSALLCVAAVADRVWDHWAGHYIDATAKWQMGERIVATGPTIRSNEGVLVVGWNRMEFNIAADERPASSCLSCGTESRDTHWSLGVISPLRRSGFAFNTTGAEDLGFYPYRVWSIEAPHWFIATLAAIAPGVWLVGHLRRRRDCDANRCRRCGYDCRATPARCPECGEALTRSDGRR